MVGFPPKSSILMGFSIIFTIHFGGNTPIFGNTRIGKIRRSLTKIGTRSNNSIEIGGGAPRGRKGH